MNCIGRLELTSLTRAVAPPAARQLGVVYTALGIAGAVVFGPTGMHPADVVAAAGSREVRLALWGLWMAGVGPAVVAAVRAPAARYLRSLPISRAAQLAVPGGLAVLAQWPVVLLWALGGAPLAGVALALASAAVALALAVQPRDWGDRARVALAVVAVAAALAWPLPPLALAGVGAAIGAIALPAAWARAPERPARLRLVGIAGPAPVALALATLAHIVRARPVALARAGLVVAVGALLAGALIRTNQLAGTAAASMAAAIAAPVMALALGSAAIAAADHERAARWLLASGGTSGVVRGVASAAPLVFLGIVAGAGFGLLCVAVGNLGVADAVRVVAGAIAAAVGWALLGLFLSRRFLARERVDAMRVLALLLAAAIPCAVASSWLDDAIALLALGGGAAALLVSADSGGA